jgi:anion-transporting  ArsA/GET3 family ATPase
MTPLFDLELIVVSGKGGVGRTTVAAALARAAADAGKRVLLAASTTTDRLARMFGRSEPVGTQVVTLAPGIDAVNMTSESALHEYGLLILRSELVTRALFENRAVRGFLGAVPGLDAYAILGKAWWHTTEVSGGRPRYDLVILDGPASGHATLMLRIPGAILAAMPKGPLARDARALQDLLHDPARAALLIVTLAEELPARESVELATAARETLGLTLGPLVVNALPSEAHTAPPLAALLDRLPTLNVAGTAAGTVVAAGAASAAAAVAGAATGTAGVPPGSDAALWATLRLAASAGAQRRLADTVVARLRGELGLPIVALPRLPTVDLGPTAIAELATYFIPQRIP